MSEHMEFVFDDGGRAAAGLKGFSGDCVVRAVAIASMLPYKQVYDGLHGVMRDSRLKRHRKSPRDGVFRGQVKRYLAALGWTWVPTMKIGQGCKVHLVAGELPMGRLVVQVSKHLTAVINGVIHDTHNPQRQTAWIDDDGKTTRITQRCVYGYWVAP
jgi:hypothetical protein